MLRVIAVHGRLLFPCGRIGLSRSAAGLRCGLACRLGLCSALHLFFRIGADGTDAVEGCAFCHDHFCGGDIASDDALAVESHGVAGPQIAFDGAIDLDAACLDIGFAQGVFADEQFTFAGDGAIELAVDFRGAFKGEFAFEMGIGTDHGCFASLSHENTPGVGSTDAGPLTLHVWFCSPAPPGSLVRQCTRKPAASLSREMAGFAAVVGRDAWFRAIFRPWQAAGRMIWPMSTPAHDPAHHPLVKALAGSLRPRCCVRRGDHLLLAVSGGCDSLALLRAMHLLAPRNRWQLTLTVGHVQHHLRPQAEEDARFVEQLAQRLQLPYLRADLEPGNWRGNREAAARQHRYRALAQLARQADADAIVTAHHADDQLETMLMRLIRGSALSGMAAMAWRRRLPAVDPPLYLLRPMLGVTRATLVDFLHYVDQPWREDHTNADITRTRARLRHEVLPVLQALRSDAPVKANDLAGHLRQVDRVMQQQIRQLLEQVRQPGRDGNLAGQVTLARSALRSQPRVLVAGVMRLVLQQHGVNADALNATRLHQLSRMVMDQQGGTRTCRIGGDVTVTVTGDMVQVQRER